MCGIAGIINRDGMAVDRSLLQKMSSAISHRGPDGDGLFLEENAGLAHRRLAIIDIKGGAQPMESSDGRFVIVYNGELYNYRELKKELSGQYSFKTDSDTEVLLASYAIWGADSLQRFNGIFSFAIWDRREKKLFAARDNFGVKPFYYFEGDGKFIFASEIKAILEAEPSLRTLDEQNLNMALTYRYSPSPRTLFKDIKKLRPGHFAQFDKNGFSEQRFFKNAPPRAQIKDIRDIEDEAWRMLDSAVKRQLVSDVPVGIFLSGGVDSSLLATIAARHYGSALTAFTAGFEGDYSIDETALAADTAQKLGVRHEKVLLGKSDFAGILEEMIWHLEEPVATTSAVPFYALCRKVKESHKAALSGQGVDELFGGYLRHYAEKVSGHLRTMFPAGILKGASRLFSGGGGKIERAFYSLGEPEDSKRFLKVFSLFNSDMRSKILERPFPDDPSPLEYFNGDIKGGDSLNKMLYLEMRTSLPDDLLFYTDKVSMAHSIEVRVPYLDLEFARFVESLPSNLKVSGFKRKQLFKKLAERELSPEILKRKKLGFETPVKGWLREELIYGFSDRLCSPSSATASLYKKGALEDILQKHRKGKGDYSKQIFMLLSVELWAKRFGASV